MRNPGPYLLQTSVRICEIYALNGITLSLFWFTRYSVYKNLVPSVSAKFLQPRDVTTSAARSEREMARHAQCRSVEEGSGTQSSCEY